MPLSGRTKLRFEMWEHFNTPQYVHDARKNSELVAKFKHLIDDPVDYSQRYIGEARIYIVQDLFINPNHVEVLPGEKTYDGPIRYAEPHQFLVPITQDRVYDIIEDCLLNCLSANYVPLDIIQSVRKKLRVVARRFIRNYEAGSPFSSPADEYRHARNCFDQEFFCEGFPSYVLSQESIAA